MGRHAAAPVKVPWNLAQMRPLQQVRRRGRRRAQSGLFRGGPAHPSTILSKVSGAAANHPHAGAAGPRAGPETGVRLTAYTRTRVNAMTMRNYMTLTTDENFYNEKTRHEGI